MSRSVETSVTKRVGNSCECLFYSKNILLRATFSFQLIIKWYGTRNAPGTKDFSPFKEWNLFVSMLFEQIGRPTEEINKENGDRSMDLESDNSHIKRRKSDVIHGSDSDWNFLCNIFQSVQSDPRDTENRPLLTYKCESQLFPHIPLIFYTLHLLYEDLKLDTSLVNEIKWLGQLLHQLSVDLNLKPFECHYVTDFPELLRNNRQVIIKDQDANKLLHTSFYFSTDVPNLFKFIYSVICGVATRPYPYIKEINVTSKNIAQIISLIFERVTDLKTCVKKIVPPGGRHELATNHDEMPEKVLYDETTSLSHKIIYHLIDMGEFFCLFNLKKRKIG